MTDEELIIKCVDKSKQNEALKKLKEGYPVQYIIGNVDFMGIPIDVNENVLIPRFETEYLVDTTLKYLKKINKTNLNILEIGTGSGCISIALAKNIKGSITSIDISESALEVAKHNAKLNNVIINYQNIDIHNFNTNAKYDLIISNPPYVKEGTFVDDKTKYEPQNAIFASENGLHFYKVILEGLHNNLNENYLIAFEIDDKEGDVITEMVRKYLPNSYVRVEKDLNNYERYVYISDIDYFYEK